MLCKFETCLFFTERVGDIHYSFGISFQFFEILVCFDGLIKKVFVCLFVLDFLVFLVLGFWVCFGFLLIKKVFVCWFFLVFFGFFGFCFFRAFLL